RREMVARNRPRKPAEFVFAACGCVATAIATETARCYSLASMICGGLGVVMSTGCGPRTRIITPPKFLFRWLLPLHCRPAHHVSPLERARYRCKSPGETQRALDG